MILFHAVSGAMMSNSMYHQGIAMLDLNDPSKVIALPNQYIMAPELPFERVGRVENMIFCTCHVVENGRVNMYYSACDTCIYLASFDLDEMAKSVMSIPQGKW